MKSNRLTRLSALSAAIAIAAGAFAAHGAHGQTSDWLRTGGMYQLVHAVGAMVVAPMSRLGAILVLAGSVLFAGTLYLMAFGGPHWLGAVTPLGGVAMIAGWLAVALRR